MKFMVDGVAYELVSIDRFSLRELKDLEKVTGLVTNQIGRMQETCVCGCPLGAHRNPTEKDKGTACSRCGCEAFADVTPSEVSSAVMWLSMRRDEPGLTYDKAEEITQDRIELVPDVVEAPKAKRASKSAGTPTSSD